MSLNLWHLKKNQQAKILGFQKDLENRFLTRLQDFGFHPGELVTCIQSPAFGAPKLYRVHDTVYSIDDTLAKLVHIEN